MSADGPGAQESEGSVYRVRDPGETDPESGTSSGLIAGGNVHSPPVQSEAGRRRPRRPRRPSGGFVPIHRPSEMGSSPIVRTNSNGQVPDHAATSRERDLELARDLLQSGQRGMRWVERRWDQFFYWFDEQWSMGIGRQCCILFCCQIIVIGLSGVILWLARQSDTEFGYVPEAPFCDDPSTNATCEGANLGLESGHIFTSMWDAWCYFADPGTHADEETWGRRIPALIVAVLGILFMATIIGFVSNAMIQKMEDMRAGRSAVVENGHILLLGWNSSTTSLIKELTIANESEGGVTIVVLADARNVDHKKQKKDIENTFDATIHSKRGSKIVVRIGNYTLMSELQKVSAPQARAVVVQAPNGNADKADATTLRTVLSLKGLERQSGAFSGHVIAELRDVDNQLLIQTVGEHGVQTIVSHDIIGRIMIKSARQPGLAEVYETILGFEGAEFYMKSWGEQLAGLKFGDLAECFDKAIPFGVHRPRVVQAEDAAHARRRGHERTVQHLFATGSTGSAGTSASTGGHVTPSSEIVSVEPDEGVMLNPPRDMLIEAEDEIVVLAEDDSSYNLVASKLKAARQRKRRESVVAMSRTIHPVGRPERILMCGWRRDLDDIIVLLNELTPTGSELHMISEVPLDERVVRLADGGLELEERHTARLDEDGNYILQHNGSDNLKLVQHHGNTAVRRQLLHMDREVAAFWQNLCQRENGGPGDAVAQHGTRLSAAHTTSLVHFDSVLILADQDREDSPMHSDSHALATLLLLREEQKKQLALIARRRARGDAVVQETRDCSITCEIIDPRTQEVMKENAAITSSSFYVLSTHIVSKVLGMVAERKEIIGVLTQLLGPSGSEITLEPASDFIEDEGQILTFRQVQRRCSRKERIALGYVRHYYPDEQRAGVGEYPGAQANISAPAAAAGDAHDLHMLSGMPLAAGGESTAPLPQELDKAVEWSLNDEIIVIRGRTDKAEILRNFGILFEEDKTITTDAPAHGSKEHDGNEAGGVSAMLRRAQSRGSL